MKSITRLFYLSAVLSAGTSLAQAATVNDPRCERLQDPLGIDMPQPALGWSVESGTRGDVQTAYQVLVAPTPALLAADHGDLWDSGKVASDVSAQVEYAGKPSDWSPPASWTMGLLDEKDWQGSWIGARPGTPSGKRVPMRDGNLPPAQPGPIDPADAPAVLLRHEVDLPKRVVHATVSFCGLGYGELYINGKRVGDRRLDPAFTDYMRRVLYSTYDVPRAASLRRRPKPSGSCAWTTAPRCMRSGRATINSPPPPMPWYHRPLCFQLLPARPAQSGWSARPPVISPPR